MSNDATPVAATGEALSIVGQPATLAHLLHAGGIGFVALARRPGPNGEAFYARHYRYDRLVPNLPARLTPGDWYLSANGFRKPRRAISTLVSIRASFIDLDHYKTSLWSGRTPHEVWHAVADRLVVRGMPLPSAAIFTGRGLQLIWPLGGLPVIVLPRWDAVQERLARSLVEFGADANALDAARILRLPGTLNSKSGLEAGFLHLDLDRRVDFEELANAVLPVDRYELRERRALRQLGMPVSPSRSHVSRTNVARFVSMMLADIERLIDHRWGGIIPETWRNQTIFVYGTFLARRTGYQRLEEPLHAFAAKRSDLPADEVGTIVASIVSKIIEDGRGYRYSIAGAADALGITAEEATAAGLLRLSPPDPTREVERLEAKRVRDRDRQRARRIEVGTRSRTESLTATMPWATAGMSRSTWYRHRLHLPPLEHAALPAETDSSPATGGEAPPTSVGPAPSNKLLGDCR